MKRTWTIIGVHDVPRSFKWYQSLFGQPLTAPAHSEAVENHPSLMSPDDGTPGNGLLLFFRVDDYGPALRRARALVPQLAEEPHVNPNTRTKEFSLRDPDGYYVTISALSSIERAAVAAQRPNKRPRLRRGREG